MRAWFKRLFPQSIKEEINLTGINRETERLKKAVKTLNHQADSLKRERSEMSQMLDEALNGVGRKHRQ